MSSILATRPERKLAALGRKLADPERKLADLGRSLARVWRARSLALRSAP
jgi:hypothetical protein